MLGNPFMLVFLANHEAGDVLKENERDLPLRTNLYEIGPFLCTLAEENTIIGDNPNLLVINLAKSGEQSRPILLLVLLKLRAIKNPSQYLPAIKSLLVIWRDNIVQLFNIIQWFLNVRKVDVDFRGVQLNGNRLLRWLRCFCRGIGLIISSRLGGRKLLRFLCAQMHRRGPNLSLLILSLPSPVAVINYKSTGPPKKIVPFPLTMMFSSAMAGT